MMRVFGGIKRFFRSDLLGQPLAAAIVTLLFAPFSIYLGFEINGRLAKPIISIEYVTKFDEKIYVNMSKIRKVANKIMASRLFNKFRMENISNYQLLDIVRLLDGDDDKFNSAISKYRFFLDAEIKKVNIDIGELSNKDFIDKKILINDLIALDETISEGELDKKILQLYNDKIDTIQEVIVTLDDLELLKNKGAIITTKLKVSLLNKGATDGLVRNVGFLTYNKIKFKIRKVPAPKKLDNFSAVPTYIVNESFGKYAENSIGKIQKNTMSEFWFLVEVKSTQNSICNEGGSYELELFDQDKNVIRKQILCN